MVTAHGPPRVCHNNINSNNIINNNGTSLPGSIIKLTTLFHWSPPLAPPINLQGFATTISIAATSSSTTRTPLFTWKHYKADYVVPLIPAPGSAHGPPGVQVGYRGRHTRIPTNALQTTGNIKGLISISWFPRLNM